MEIINKQISRNYRIKDRFSAGIVLTGPEVKSCKLGKINFKGAYCGFEALEGSEPERALEFLYLKNFYIAPYLPARREQADYNPYRARKLLLNKKELAFLLGKSKEHRITIVPVRIYTKMRLVKIEIAVAYGLKKVDKRERIKKQEFERRKRRIMSL